MLPFKYLLAVLFIFSLLAVGSCIYISPEKAQKTVCIKPYMTYESYCCLDQNNNSLCDFREVKSDTQKPGIISSPEPSIDINVRISKVLDGDTVVLDGGEVLRLLGIDAPEKGQYGYFAAMNRLGQLVEGKEVGLEKDREGVDSEGRLVRYLWLDGVNVNLLLVRDGLARASIATPNVLHEQSILEAQKSAEREGIGLWVSGFELDRNACDDRCLQVTTFNYDAFGDDCDNLENEYVVIHNYCTGSCDFTGWTISNGGIQTYTFKNFSVRPREYFILFTGAGSDTDLYLYWDNKLGICDAVWPNDKGALYLRNRDDELMLRYSYFDVDRTEN